MSSVTVPVHAYCLSMTSCVSVPRHPQSGTGLDGVGAKTRESILGLYHKTAEMKVRMPEPFRAATLRMDPVKRGSMKGA